MLLAAPRAASRRAARLLIVNELGHVLLIRRDEHGRPFWEAPGGSLEGGESFELAAARLAVDEIGLGGLRFEPMWQSVNEFTTRGRKIRQRVQFFLCRTQRDVVAHSERVAQPHEAEGILEWRWWSVSDLERSSETVYPVDLAARLRGMTSEPASAGAAHITMTEALARLPAEGGVRFVELFRHGSLSVEMYAPRGHDPQLPHTRDEVYVVAQGSGTFWDGETRRPFVAGDFLFVEAGRPHRFEEFTRDVAVWVMFYGPDGGERA